VPAPNLKPLQRLLKLNDIAYFRSQNAWARTPLPVVNRSIIARHRRHWSYVRLSARVMLDPRDLAAEREQEAQMAVTVAAMARALGYTVDGESPGTFRLGGKPS
jgi:hypothetical protein